MIEPVIAWIQATPVAQFMQLSPWAFPVLEAIHVLAITLVFGVIAVVDLRLLGIASNNRRFTEVAADCLHWTWIAFALAVLTGLGMFSANASAYINNFYFQLKMVLLVFAGVNMLYFEIVTARTAGTWHIDTVGVPGAARVAGALSLCFWFAVVVCGRWIGFTLFSLPF